MNLTEYQNYHESKSHTSLEFPYNTYLAVFLWTLRMFPFTGTMRWN